MRRHRMLARGVAVAVVSAVFVLPPAFLVLGSLRLPGLAPPDGFEWLPEPLAWENYRTVADLVPLATYLRNSALVVAVAVPVTVVVASLAGFALATAGPRQRAVLLWLTLVALMVPASALWVPRFVLFRWLGLTDTLLAVGSPALMGTSPFFVLLFALTYARLPPTLFESAVLDGWSPLGVWRRVALPLGWPAAAAVATLAFASHWSNLIEPLLYLSSPERTTVALGLQALAASEPTNFPLLLAASMIATVPTVGAFLVTQRAFLVRTLGG